MKLSSIVFLGVCLTVLLLVPTPVDADQLEGEQGWCTLNCDWNTWYGPCGEIPRSCDEVRQFQAGFGGAEEAPLTYENGSCPTEEASLLFDGSSSD